MKKEGRIFGRNCVKVAQSEMDSELQQRGKTMRRERGKRSPTAVRRDKVWPAKSENVDQWGEEGKADYSVSENSNGDRKTVSFDWAAPDEARKELYGEIETEGEDTVNVDQVCETMP